jgi:site-specific DNA recombinase
VPTEEADRRVLAQAKDDAQARIADLYTARYQRGEFQSAAELEVYESLMSRLRSQRDAAEAALGRLGPAPTIDIGALLESELSERGWIALPVARQRDLLKLAIRAVVVYNATEPLEDRFQILWYDEEPPEPRSKWPVGQ